MHARARARTRARAPAHAHAHAQARALSLERELPQSALEVFLACPGTCFGACLECSWVVPWALWG
eukprot:11457767-Alexandrium_andersonii.AAC.1